MRTYHETLAANARYVASGKHVALPVRPKRELAVITCMDSRIRAFPMFGLELGDAHILRTAGARVTDDVLRSLALSTHILGTRSILVIGHTRCGLHDPDGSIEAKLTEAMGRTPFTLSWGTFTDPAEAIGNDCDRLLRWPDRPDGLEVAGLLLDVDDGRLVPVREPTVAEPLVRDPGQA